MSRLKKFLGIEGVKVSFDEFTRIDVDGNMVSGQLLIKSNVPATILSINIQVIEQYQRGRKNDQRTSEFILLNKTIQPNHLVVNQEKTLEIPFNYKILQNKSEMDLLEERNFFIKPLIGLAKKLYRVKSIYTITATLQIEGIAIKPFSKKILVFGK